MHEVICFYIKAFDDFIIVEVWKQIEDFLKVVDYVWIDGKFVWKNVFKISSHLINTESKSFKTSHFIRYLLR